MEETLGDWKSRLYRLNPPALGFIESAQADESLYSPRLFTNGDRSLGHSR
ncbi:hypothetical protein [Nostoc sp.]